MLIYCILYTALECIYLSGFCLFKTLVVSESDKYMFNCLCLFIVALHWFNWVYFNKGAVKRAPLKRAR